MNISKKTLISLVGAIGLLLIVLAKLGLSAPASVTKISPETTVQKTTSSESVDVVSTDPSPLDNATILPTQTISITFNQPAQNVPELKMKIYPEIDLKVELSSDRKTVKISPKTFFGLKQGYTITIPAGAKFDNGTLDKDLNFQISTIDYSGV